MLNRTASVAPALVTSTRAAVVPAVSNRQIARFASACEREGDHYHAALAIAALEGDESAREEVAEMMATLRASARR